jgi:hypothetical protein
MALGDSKLSEAIIFIARRIAAAKKKKTPQFSLHVSLAN